MEQERIAREKEEQEKKLKEQKLKEEFGDASSQWEKDKKEMREQQQQSKRSSVASPELHQAEDAAKDSGVIA